MSAKHLHIHGLVQGVGFRWSLAHEAQRLGLTGWVRNRRDGTVEAVVCGDATALARMIAWAHRGPPAARVSDVEVAEAEGEFNSFEQWSTV